MTPTDALDYYYIIPVAVGVWLLLGVVVRVWRELR